MREEEEERGCEEVERLREELGAEEYELPRDPDGLRGAGPSCV